MLDISQNTDNGASNDNGGGGFANAVNAIGGLVGNVGDIITGEPIQTDNEIRLEKNTMIFIGGAILAVLLCLKKKR